VGAMDNLENLAVIPVGNHLVKIGGHRGSNVLPNSLQ
jgi:hypothetical protein